MFLLFLSPKRATLWWSISPKYSFCEAGGNCNWLMSWTVLGVIPPVYILQEMLYKGIDKKGLNTCILTFWKKKQIQYNVNVTPVYSWKYKVHQHEYCLKSKRTVWLNVLAINSKFMIVQVYIFHHFRFFKVDRLFVSGCYSLLASKVKYSLFSLLVCTFLEAIGSSQSGVVEGSTLL